MILPIPQFLGHSPSHAVACADSPQWLHDYDDDDDENHGPDLRNILRFIIRLPWDQLTIVSYDMIRSIFGIGKQIKYVI